MEIREVTVEDARLLQEIYAPYVEQTAISFEKETPSVEEFRRRIGEITEKYPYFKAVDNGETVGYAYATVFKPRAAYAWSVECTVYVRRDRKRQGIGKALYHRLEEALEQMGIRNMNACITFPIVPDEYLTEDSFRFHTRMGFSLVGRFHRVANKFGRWYDMIWMEKSIGTHEPDPEEPRFGQWR